MNAIDKYTFEPAVHSMGELRFLLDHLGEPPHVALHKGAPEGVNPAQIQKTLGVIQELKALEEAHKQPWAGLEPIRDSIERYLLWSERTQEISRLTKGAIPHASQFGWDSSGRAFKYAIDADSAEMVRTEILDDGSRRSFTVQLLLPDGAAHFDIATVAPWISKTKQTFVNDALIVKADPKAKHGTITCPVCEKSENYELSSKVSERTAWSRMARHLKSARFEVARHRMLYRKHYESPTTRT